MKAVLRSFWLGLLTLALTACGKPYEFHGTLYNPIMPAPAIVGVQGGGQPFALTDLQDKIKVIFFGYTSCPDVCPTTLTNLRMVYEKLPPPVRDKVAVVFVSVDPDRDTPDRLLNYVAAFNPTFTGVQVPADKLEEVKKGYGVFSQKHSVEGASAAGYLVDHTAYVYVVDGKNNLREVFAPDTPVDDMVNDLQQLAQNG